MQPYLIWVFSGPEQREKKNFVFAVWLEHIWNIQGVPEEAAIFDMGVLWTRTKEKNLCFLCLARAYLEYTECF